MHYAIAHFLVSQVIWLAAAAVAVFVFGAPFLAIANPLSGGAFYAERERLDHRANGWWDTAGLLAPFLPCIALEALLLWYRGYPDPKVFGLQLAAFTFLGGALRELEKTHKWRAGWSFTWRAFVFLILIGLTLAVLQDQFGASGT